MKQFGIKIDLIKYIFHGPVIFALYLQEYLMDECHICGIMNQCDTKIDLIFVCRSMTYISWSSDFA